MSIGKIGGLAAALLGTAAVGFAAGALTVMSVMEAVTSDDDGDDEDFWDDDEECKACGPVRTCGCQCGDMKADHGHGAESCCCGRSSTEASVEECDCPCEDADVGDKPCADAEACDGSCDCEFYDVAADADVGDDPCVCKHGKAEAEADPDFGSDQPEDI